MILLAYELGKFPHEVMQIPHRDFIDLLAEKHLQANAKDEPKPMSAKEFRASMKHLVKK